MTYLRPVDAAFFQNFSNVSTVVSVSNTLIVMADGPYSGAVGGVFSSSGVGIATSITYSYDNVPYVVFSGFSISSTNPNASFSIFNGNDSIFGSTGNDTFFVTPGNDTYNGGSGRDTLLIDVNRSYATVTASGTSHVLRGTGKTDTLNNVERLSFLDGTLALDVKAGENAGSAYRAYQAAFDRKPDTAGLKFWIDRMDAGASLTEVALGFVQSNEFQKLNPSTSTAGMINTYYQNVLHRAPDATGLAFWSNQAANGMQAHEMLAAFSESNENINNTAAAIKDGIWLG